MKERRAIAEIEVDADKGWNLPTFGSRKPTRYWAHVHFEKDPMWGKKTWTFIVDLGEKSCSSGVNVDATVFFMAPDAPHNLLQVGERFELLCGESHYGRGVIKNVFEVEKTT